MRYGYCRTSKPKQSIERQIRNIKAAFPDAVIVQEVFTRTRLDRPEWLKLMRRIQPGDKIIFDSVSRMSGDAKEGFAAYEELYQKDLLIKSSRNFRFLGRRKNAIQNQAAERFKIKTAASQMV